MRKYMSFALATRTYLSAFNRATPALFLKRTHYYLPRMVTESSFRKFPCVIVLPEVDNNPEIDKALQPGTDGLPKFEEWNLYYCFAGVGKNSLNFELKLREFEEKLQKSQMSFDKMLQHLYDAEKDLHFTWNTTRLLNGAKGHIYIDEVYKKLEKHVILAVEQRYRCRTFVDKLKELKKSGSLTCVQERIANAFLFEAANSGLFLTTPTKDTTFSQLHSKMQATKGDYAKNLSVSMNQIAIMMPDAESMQEFPADLKMHMAFNAQSKDAENGPWMVKLNGTTYPNVLEYCGDKVLRYSIWKSNLMLCSHSLDKQLSNHHNVKDMVEDRKLLAGLMGYENYAQYSMSTKMAGSVDNVMAMITDLGSEARSALANEVDSLKDLAAVNGQNSPLEECDVPFWVRQQKKILYSVDEERLREYFPLHHVWKGMISFVESLFDLVVEESHASTYHPDVTLFKVTEKDGTFLGHFYLDPYRRYGMKAEGTLGAGYSITIAPRSHTQTPIVALLYNFMTPTATNAQSLLSVNDIRTLFSVFGKALQCLLSKTQYCDVSGTTNMEWDAVDMTPKFMAYWLHNEALLKSLSKHYVTGEELSIVDVRNLISSYSVGAGFKYCQQLLLSHYDLRLHSETTPWLTILRELWPQYSPFAFDESNSAALRFAHIFTGPYAASYYCSIWSDMLAAQAYSQFQDHPHDIASLGSKYKQAFLSYGGSRSTKESFEEFLGVEANIEALCRLNNLQ